MSMLKNLVEKIENKQAKLAIIGLGYVGLPVACMFADAGFRVIGVDTKKERIDVINRGISPIEGYEPGLPELISKVIFNKQFLATTDYKQLNDADIILIDVETPTDDQHVPQYVALRNVCHSLGKVIKEGALVIVESTIAPGTMDTLVRPLLEVSSGKTSNIDFYLGVCPERVMPGKLLANLKNMSRVCGGETPEVSEVLRVLYKNVVQADLDPADLVTAELTKTAENTYRDVNIAFANELALICQVTGADFLKVRELVNKSPGRNVLFAGAGVGGHCIPKDPWLLAYGAKEKVDLKLIPAARAVNDSMPIFIGRMVKTILEDTGKRLDDAQVTILGYSYLADSDDTRNSPSEALCEYLKSEKAKVIIQDPYVLEFQVSVEDAVSGSDIVVLMVAHADYKQIDLKKLKTSLRLPILVDGRRLFDPEEVRNAGLDYYGIGFGLIERD